MWGPPLQNDQITLEITRIQRMQNRAVRITKSLRKYDHVSCHRRELKWLPIASMVQLQSITAMSRYLHQGKTLQLDPPILLGWQHSYATRCSNYYANPCAS